MIAYKLCYIFILILLLKSNIKNIYITSTYSSFRVKLTQKLEWIVWDTWNVLNLIQIFQLYNCFTIYIGYNVWDANCIVEYLKQRTVVFSYYTIVLRKCSRIVYDYVNDIFFHRVSKSIITTDLRYLMRDSCNRIWMTSRHIRDCECWLIWRSCD